MESEICFFVSDQDEELIGYMSRIIVERSPRQVLILGPGAHRRLCIDDFR